MAKILNMSQTGYSKYETGEKDIPADLRFNFLNPPYYLDNIKCFGYNIINKYRCDRRSYL